MRTPSTDPAAYSIEDFCARYGISRSSAYLEIAAGRLAAIKARGRTLIARAAADNWLASLPPARVLEGAA
jgi:hypothetical protein